MSPFLTALIASATILIIILATDLGRRRLTNMRMARSLIAVAIVIALFVHSLPTGGNDISLQLVGIGVGAICGLIAGALLPAHRDPATGHIFTRGGIGYALLWVILSSSRVVFAYGTEHWFPQGIIKFSIDYKLSGQDVYANAFVFMSLAMVLARTAVLLTRRRKLLAQGNAATKQAEPVRTH
ncbi:hypothetical protein ACFOSC_17080 [Streptantibioticus rubrisoli]|uniref:Integral membrane protein n=1 Tax=Streptantibioticus rubrisoli TaxID=1387313 RepID=A0ABT1PGS5_9ACTN|nr:hypothetical protein [Streptantibioticus rubrisoli]MCQ4044559.1 hypothetical protein [Streptantibioticus rubrisoli]